MSDYIKKEDIVNLAVMMQTHLWTREQTYNAIFCLPSADVIEVIRCRDCKYWQPHTQYGYDYDLGVYNDYCALLIPDDDFYAVPKPADGYCDDAKKRDPE